MIFGIRVKMVHTKSWKEALDMASWYHGFNELGQAYLIPILGLEI